MKLKYEALINNRTWIHIPAHSKIIGNKWVFKVTLKPDKSLQKYKARVVTKEYTYTKSIDYIETFDPVVKPKTIKVL